MFSLLGYGVGAIYSAFMLLTILWAVALVVIWNDADETYGTGLFWALAVLVAPVFSIPIYWLMRLGTHRSLDEEIAADERLERKKAFGQRFSGLALDLERQLHPNCEAESVEDDGRLDRRPDFKPFTPTFAAQAEEWRRRTGGDAHSSAPGTDVIQQLPSIRSRRGSDAGTARSADISASSQGCGDSAGNTRLNEQLSWRHRHAAVKSRWDSSRPGSASRAARGDQLP